MNPHVPKLVGALVCLCLMAPALAEPVLLLQLERDQSGIHLVSQEVRDMAYKPSRSAQKDAAQGRVHKARAGWLAQIVRADGSIEREVELEDPLAIRGEFAASQPGRDSHNDRVDQSRSSGQFTVQVPVSSGDVSVRIIERKAVQHAAAKARRMASAVDEAGSADSDGDDIKGEFKVKGGKR